MTTAPGLSQPVRQRDGETEAHARATGGKRTASSFSGHSSLQTVRSAEKGIPKAEAARLFSKIAAVAERPVGKLRAELIPDSSWKRSGERLRPTASQTVARLRRVVAIATNIWESEQEAIGWLTGRHRMLGGATPYSLLKTEAGGRAVEDILAALEYGFSA
jgi:putative toxin-antitoxin system antitoxin component (TIGR02293 family)